MANALVDGLNQPDLLSTGGVDNAELAAAAASGSKVSAEYAPAKIGSPAVGGNMIQAGSAALGAGSDAWVVFPAGTFLAVPIVSVTSYKTANTWFFVAAGSVVAGSFYIQGKTASDDFSWLAIGSGRL